MNRINVIFIFGRIKVVALPLEKLKTIHLLYYQLKNTFHKFQVNHF